MKASMYAAETAEALYWLLGTSVQKYAPL